MDFSSSFIIAFLIFSLVSSLTPGPNNTMLLISGVNFGFRRTLPHLTGVTIGFGILVIVVGMGIAEIFTKWPILYTALRYGCAAYLLYLAWQILRSSHVKLKEGAAKPVSFTQAAAFQWANPKAWVMSIVAVTTYIPKSHFVINVTILMTVLLIFVFLSGGTWALFGNWIQRFLHRPHYLRIFNIAMAALLIVSLYPIIWEK